MPRTSFPRQKKECRIYSCTPSEPHTLSRLWDNGRKFFIIFLKNIPAEDHGRLAYIETVLLCPDRQLFDRM